MGKTLMGGSEHEENIDLLTPEQKQFLGSILGDPATAQNASQAYNQFLQPSSPEQYEDVFNKSVVDPSMKQYQEKILPAIQQRFIDHGSGASSALNQALSQSATDLTKGISEQYGNFFNQQQQNQLSALGGVTGLSQQKQFQPIVSTSGGILGPIIKGLGQTASAYFGSKTF